MEAIAITRRPDAGAPRNAADPGASKTVRKNAGAVQIRNSISLVQRKLFSVALFNAYDDLPNFSVVSHEIPLGLLAYLAGFNSNNTQYLKDALTDLVSHAIHWNIQRVDGKEAWAVSALLASARIEDGTVYYSFSPELRRRLYNPEVYAQLEIMVIRAFKSGYALALYENCKLYVKEGATADWSPKELRELLGAWDNPTYENFSRFMDKVIKPAVAEVNRLSELRVAPVLKREGRRVVSVWFKVEEVDAEEGKLTPVNPLQGRDADLAMRIQSEIGLVYAQVLKLFEEHSDKHLLAALEYAKDRYAQGRVQKGKLAGYFLTVVRKAAPDSLAMPQAGLTLPPPKPVSEEERAATAAAEAKKEARKRQLDAAEAAWQAMPAEEQESLRRGFLESLLADDNRIVYDSLRRSKDLTPGTMGYRMLMSWLVDKAGILPVE